jgi:hypothetical protein
MAPNKLIESQAEETITKTPRGEMEIGRFLFLTNRAVAPSTRAIAMGMIDEESTEYSLQMIAVPIGKTKEMPIIERIMQMILKKVKMLIRLNFLLRIFPEYADYLHLL